MLLLTNRKKAKPIQNLGEIDVLCCDKTATITEGVVTLRKAIDIDGRENKKIQIYAYLNAFYETGFSNPVDEALRTSGGPGISGYTKFDEVRYDFIRKRLSILALKRKVSA